MYPKELSKRKNETLKVLDTKYMKDDTTANGKYDHATIGLRYEQPILFGLSGQLKSSKALTVCRKDPLLSTGIQTLNLMLDPSKTPERIETVQTAKENWYKKFGSLNFSQAYDKLFELLWYSRLPCVDVKNITSQERDEMSVIKRCYWRSQLVDCASIFVTRSTDRGMCCAFNVGNADKLYKSTKYRTAAENMQAKTRAESFPGVPNG